MPPEHPGEIPQGLEPNMRDPTKPAFKVFLCLKPCLCNPTVCETAPGADYAIVFQLMDEYHKSWFDLCLQVLKLFIEHRFS